MRVLKLAVCFWVVLTSNPRKSRETQREFGKEIASRLKLSADGKYVLWPQPTDDPEDPQNVSFASKSVSQSMTRILNQWSNVQKNMQLFIVVLASIVSDFDAAIGMSPYDDMEHNTEMFQEFPRSLPWQSSITKLQVRLTTSCRTGVSS